MTELALTWAGRLEEQELRVWLKMRDEAAERGDLLSLYRNVSWRCGGGESEESGV